MGLQAQQRMTWRRRFQLLQTSSGHTSGSLRSGEARPWTMPHAPPRRTAAAHALGRPPALLTAFGQWRDKTHSASGVAQHNPYTRLTTASVCRLAGPVTKTETPDKQAQQSACTVRPWATHVVTLCLHSTEQPAASISNATPRFPPSLAPHLHPAVHPSWHSCSAT
jgi:hypothetical protein